MKQGSLIFGIVLIAMATASGAARAGDALQFRVERPAEGVIVFTEESPWESNHVVLVTDKGLVLVDPGGHPITAEAIRKAVQKELGRSDFAYVIDHHHHWGHSWGNGSFPEAVVIGQEGAVAIMEQEAGTREATIEQHRSMAQRADADLEKLDPDSDEARGARLAKAHAERIIEGLSKKDFHIRTPDITFSDRMTLDLGNMTLEFFFLGRGHSDTDSVIFIPEKGVLMQGCFFYKVRNLPFFGFTPVLDVDRWLDVWARILDGEAPVRTVVLGQYEMWNGEKLVLMRNYIETLRDDVRRMEAEGLGYETVQEKLTPPASLNALRVQGVSEGDIQQYHQRNVANFWRQMKESAADSVGAAIDEQGLEAGLAKYKELKARKDNEFFFDENGFNLLGYRYLQNEKITEAIAVFKLNVEAFPDSWNVYDSLGEAYMTNGDRDPAIQCYKKSIEINPQNSNGIAMLERLEAGE